MAVRIAGTDGHLRRHQTTTIDPALRAVTAIRADGGADPALSWSDDDPDGDLRRPALQVTDATDDVSPRGGAAAGSCA